MEVWYKRARKFILEQRQKELQRSIERYPGSDYFPARKKELEEIETELAELDE